MPEPLSPPAVHGLAEDIHVLIVDDHPVVREGLAVMLDEPGYRVDGTASTGAEALRMIGASQPDVVLMDIRMPDMDGLTAAEHIKQRFPAVSVVMLTSFSNEEFLARAVSAGAAGYLRKGMPRQLLLDSIRFVREGGLMFEPSMLRDLLRSVAPATVPPTTLDPLTTRERRTLKLVVEGRTNAEIANELGYSVASVKLWVQQIIEKLAVSDRTQAAVLAVRAGIDTPIPDDDESSAPEPAG